MPHPGKESIRARERGQAAESGPALKRASKFDCLCRHAYQSRRPAMESQAKFSAVFSVL
jgi:hypothetical protein